MAFFRVSGAEVSSPQDGTLALTHSDRLDRGSVEMKPSAAPWVSFVLVAMLIGFCADSTFSQAFSAKGPIKMDNAEIQKAQAALAKHEATLMDVPGVVGVGIGMTETGKDAAIHVYLDVQATGGTIPAAIPEQLDHVPVRVIKTDGMKAR